MSNIDDLLKRLDEAHAEAQEFNRETYGERDFDPEEDTLYSEAAAAIRKLTEGEEVDADTTSPLLPGDTVETLIPYTDVFGYSFPKGKVGTVELIYLDEEFPFRIRFEGIDFAIGYTRAELGKVGS